jgi:hypothetical protein
MSRILLWCFTGLLLAALGTLLVRSGAELLAWPPPDAELETATKELTDADLSGRLRERYLHRAVEESGAINLVSAIYLGYRAFDTLGETIVLVLSVAGVLLLTGVRQ